MAATSPAPRSIMRRLNGSTPSTPARQALVDDEISHRQSLGPSSLQDIIAQLSPPPSTPRRRSVQFSPAPAHVFETYSAADYDRSIPESPPHPSRSGHLDGADLALFRQNIGRTAPLLSAAATVAPRGQQGEGRSIFTLEDPFEDDSDDDEGSGELEWRSSTPVRSARSPRPIPPLRFDSTGYDSEDEEISERRAAGPSTAAMAQDVPSSSTPISPSREQLLECPVAFLATSFSAMAMPARESVWQTPAASETRSMRFEDPINAFGGIHHSAFGEVPMPSSFSSSKPALYVATNVSATVQSPSRRSPTRTTSKSPSPVRSPVATVLQVPSTPTRSKHRSPRSPPRPALSPRENFPRPLTVSSASSLTREFRMRLLRNRQSTSDAGLGVINENEDDEN
ncbi:hypothetical protein EIP91_003829 [Steccherinum ochraceum]|uniref:Uncharacterized protein n=1 Tax=Steccherinum ochraceum TaxID=92696 RepID=A0A4V2MW24_9APHY|nr:hypothetical protein EIP91_003829 [Steccherinum ochraceum]